MTRRAQTNNTVSGSPTHALLLKTEIVIRANPETDCLCCNVGRLLLSFTISRLHVHATVILALFYLK